VNRKNLLLFLIVCSCAAIAVGIGWLIGRLAGSELKGFIGAGVGGGIGAVIGVEIAYRRGLVEADWDRILLGAPWYGFTFAGLVAASNNWPGILVALVAVIGSGVGALIAKYLLRFFIDEPPPSIL
jgi:Kef-type K+ transport system membrane component KefB